MQLFRFFFLPNLLTLGVFIFTKQRSLRSILSRPKQPQPIMDIKGVVYQIPSSSCPAVYTGETGRTMKVRMGDVNNGLAVHSLKLAIQLSGANQSGGEGRELV